MKVTFGAEMGDEEMDENEEKKDGRKHNSEIPVKEIGELLDEVSTKLPRLLDGIQKSYYSQENGINAGKSVGSFYKELIASGMSESMALRLTERFMISLKDLTDSSKKNKDE